MIPGSKNLQLYQGDTFHMIVRLKRKDPDVGEVYLDLTDCVVTAQIREVELSPSPLTEFTTTLLDQTDPDTRGGIAMNLDSSQTTTLIKSKYDLQVVWPDDDVKTYLRGDITIMAEVTRGVG